MNRIAYILGTNHIYQRDDDSCEPGSVDTFIDYLDSVCQSYEINAIGEEMSISALHDFDRAESIPAKFASTHGKSHKYCDPDRAEQERLGIEKITSLGITCARKTYPKSRLNNFAGKRI